MSKFRHPTIHQLYLMAKNDPLANKQKYEATRDDSRSELPNPSIVNYTRGEEIAFNPEHLMNQEQVSNLIENIDFCIQNVK